MILGILAELSAAPRHNPPPQPNPDSTKAAAAVPNNPGRAKPVVQFRSVPSYTCGMYHEWDWPPIRRRRYRWPPTRSRFDVYQPSGWNSLGAKKAVRIYWRVTVVIIKVMVAIPIAIMTIGAFWMLWNIIALAWA